LLMSFMVKESKVWVLIVLVTTSPFVIHVDLSLFASFKISNKP
jgi:hypothetical protein